MDAADILGAAPRTEFRARVRHSHAAQDVAGNKLTGLKKEVFDLTGKDVGANKPETPVQAFGKKHTQLKRKVHWEFTGFSNSARTDGLHLRHWQKKGIKWEDYPFARFNKKVQLLSYNDDEYEQLLRSEQWTRKQTDALMLLVQRFHLNFILVQDRWEGQGSVEALKDRFYEIQRKLHESRELPPLPDDNPLLSRPFNREWEEERKSQLTAASLRSKEQDKDEAEILEKAKKIEANIKRKRIAEKSSSSRLRDKAGALDIIRKQSRQAVDKRPPVGGVALRSTMEASAVNEPKNAAAILDAIGFQLPIACQDPQVSAAVGSLLHDLNILLSWHQRCHALSAGKHQKTSHAGTSKSRGGGNVVKGGSTSSPRGSAFKRNPSLDILFSPQGHSVEDRSAKKAKKS